MRHIIAVSGGRDSAALALYMAPKLDSLELVFADTGRELPEVYDFLKEIEAAVGQPITYIDSYGRKFDYFMERWSTPESGPFIPSPAARWCTRELKIRPFERYCKNKDLGGLPATIYIGFRSDEDRVGNYGLDAGVDYAYPFVEDDIDLDGVKRILAESGLTMPKYYQWRATGGCWCCPFQRASDWRGLKRHHPDLFQKALEEEQASNFQWNQSIPLEMIDAQLDLPLEPVGERDIDVFEFEPPCSICAK